MKAPLVCLFALAGLANATPPVLSLTQAALQKVDPDIRPDHYDIARTDLNADGREDVLALMNGKSGYRGTGGATMFILKGTADGFKSLGKIMVVTEPIYARQSVSHGFRDLLVTVNRPGAEPALAAPRFDGKTYPASPGERTAALEDSDELLFAEPTPPFDKKEELQGITFQVFSPNPRSCNRLTVTPAGLEADNTPIEMDVAGLITRSEVADINADGSPELYVYGFDGTSQTVLAWSANKPDLPAGPRPRAVERLPRRRRVRGGRRRPRPPLPDLPRRQAGLEADRQTTTDPVQAPPRRSRLAAEGGQGRGILTGNRLQQSAPLDEQAGRMGWKIRKILQRSRQRENIRTTNAPSPKAIAAVS